VLRVSPVPPTRAVLLIAIAASDFTSALIIESLAIEVAFPEEVISPVRFAFVTTVAAFPELVTPPVRFALVITVAALPEEVTPPVKLAFVVTFPAVKPDAVPVAFVITPEAGVPSAGVVRVGAVSILLVRV